MYTEHYKAFSQNINFAARILHYYLHLSAMVQKETENYKALNETPRFWNDYNFIALQTVIIFLGKIFDSQKKTHNLTKLLDVLPQSLKHFSKANLKLRKIEFSGGGFNGLEQYIKDAHELTADDVELIKTEAQKATALWRKFKPLRHRFYAHNQMLTDDERDALFKSVTYDELEQLIQILLNISNILHQAEINGRKPDFEYDYSEPANTAENEVDKLLGTLINGI